MRWLVSLTQEIFVEGDFNTETDAIAEAIAKMVDMDGMEIMEVMVAEAECLDKVTIH